LARVCPFLLPFPSPPSSPLPYCYLCSPYNPQTKLTSSKPSTDMAYNNSITTILSTLSHQLNSTEPHKALSVVFGTHNPESCDLVTSNLVKYGLAAPMEDSTLLRLRDDVIGKVFVAQLYGMLFSFRHFSLANPPPAQSLCPCDSAKLTNRNERRPHR
jgi:hypothetical protein